MDEANGELGGDEWMTAHRRVRRAGIFPSRSATDWEAAFFAAPPAHAKGGDAQRHHVQPGAGNAFAVLLNVVRSGMGGAQGTAASLSPGFRDLDFARAVEFLIAAMTFPGRSTSPPQIRCPIASSWPSARRMRHSQRPPRAGSADRVRCSVSAHGIGTGVEEPARGAGPPARCGIRVRRSRRGRKPRKTWCTAGGIASTNLSSRPAALDFSLEQRLPPES